MLRHQLAPGEQVLWHGRLAGSAPPLLPPRLELTDGAQQLFQRIRQAQRQSA